jgi:23S rRNA pseudouridine955/2504/2580 synthase
VNEETIAVTKNIVVSAALVGLTVMDAVRRAFSEVGPREVFKKTRHGEIKLNKAPCHPLDRLAADDLLTVVLHHPAPPKVKEVLRRDEWIPTPAGPLWVVYEDEDLLAVSKSSGCASHPALGHSGDTLIERVRYLLKDLVLLPGEEDFAPALANRLDIETSGISLIGKNKLARKRLGNHIQRGMIDKRYLALVAGWPSEAGEMTHPLLKRADSRQLANYPEGHPKRKPKLQEAHTRYRVLRRLEHPFQLSLIEVELLTGRTHQIRRHFADAGYPVALDKRYGDRNFNRMLSQDTGLDRMFLHAYRVELPHPLTRVKMVVTSPLPEDLCDALRAMGADPAGVNAELLPDEDGQEES